MRTFRRSDVSELPVILSLSLHDVTSTVEYDYSATNAIHIY
jgi:hypothetical protein